MAQAMTRIRAKENSVEQVTDQQKLADCPKGKRIAGNVDLSHVGLLICP